VGDRAANVTPWNTIGSTYWIAFYNSLGGQLFNEDKTQLLFDNDKALKWLSQGAQPTETQARTVGNAVGNGAANFLAARNTRLVVRTL